MEMMWAVSRAVSGGVVDTFGTREEAISRAKSYAVAGYTAVVWRRVATVQPGEPIVDPALVAEVERAIG